MPSKDAPAKCQHPNARHWMTSDEWECPDCGRRGKVRRVFVKEYDRLCADVAALKVENAVPCAGIGGGGHGCDKILHLGRTKGVFERDDKLLAYRCSDCGQVFCLPCIKLHFTTAGAVLGDQQYLKEKARAEEAEARAKMLREALEYALSEWSVHPPCASMLIDMARAALAKKEGA